MKKIYITLLTLSLFISVSAQKQIAAIYFKDGKSINGLAKIDKGKIKYKTHKKGKKQWFDHTTVSHIKIKNLKNNRYLKFYYKKVDQLNEYHLLRLYKKDSLSIYFEYREDVNAIGSSFGIIGALASRGASNNRPLNSINYYLCENDSESGFFFSDQNKKFRKETTDYFKDCPKLVEKINNKVYTKNHIAEIAYFYNTKCNK